MYDEGSLADATGNEGGRRNRREAGREGGRDLQDSAITAVTHLCYYFVL